jgi:hypothetical protein
MQFCSLIIGGLLAAIVYGGQVTIGKGTPTQYYPLFTYQHDARAQIIYLASLLSLYHKAMSSFCDMLTHFADEP